MKMATCKLIKIFIYFIGNPKIKKRLIMLVRPTNKRSDWSEQVMEYECAKGRHKHTM